MKTKKRKTTKITVPTALALICCFAVILIINNQPTENTAKDEIISLKDIPDYSGSAFIEINGNEPYFSDDDYTTSSFEYYADLDELGRCGTAYACVGTDIMPTEERGQIGRIKPSNIRISLRTGICTIAVTLSPSSLRAKVQMKSI